MAEESDGIQELIQPPESTSLLLNDFYSMGPSPFIDWEPMTQMVGVVLQPYNNLNFWIIYHMILPNKQRR